MQHTSATRNVGIQCPLRVQSSVLDIPICPPGPDSPTGQRSRRQWPSRLFTPTEPARLCPSRITRARLQSSRRSVTSQAPLAIHDLGADDRGIGFACHPVGALREGQSNHPFRTEFGFDMTQRRTPMTGMRLTVLALPVSPHATPDNPSPRGTRLRPTSACVRTARAPARGESGTLPLRATARTPVQVGKPS